MTPKRPPAHDTFSLFDNEERVLLGAETMLHQLEQFSGGVKELAAAYRKSYAEHRRHDQAVGVPAMLQCGKIHDRLEGRAR